MKQQQIRITKMTIYVRKGWRVRVCSSYYNTTLDFAWMFAS